MNSRIGIIIIFGILAGSILYYIFSVNSEPFTASSGDSANTGSTQYNINNYDLKFHDSAEDIQSQNSKASIQTDTIVITDAKGNKTKVSRDKTQGSLIYNDPEYYKYGTAAYVPSYEESILLSKTYGIYPTVFEIPTVSTTPPGMKDDDSKKESD